MKLNNATRAELWLPEPYKQDHTIKQRPGPLGEAYGGGAYGGSNLEQLLYYMQLPGGSMLMFDLSKLTLQDYRQMRDHYQVTISLWILEFMLNQIEWSIECDRADIASKVQANLAEHWPRLMHSMATAFWSGFSPNIIQYDNSIGDGKLPVELDKIKDLLPETTRVHWKQIEGYNPQGPNTVAPKIDVFDGMDLEWQSFPVPVVNSFWYPLLMENGNYYGRKLLRPAFPAYFFSQLMHLFANRYFERFGEPIPVGRYPEGDSAPSPDDPNVTVPARTMMENVLRALRNRSVVVLPSTRDQNFFERSGGANAFEWDIEYLESQMRGADFERYMLRLDEEISLALFTPVLMYRTSDVGSYNLGEQHYRLFMVMLNAIAGDMKLHIDRYILDRLVDINYGVNAPRARWVPRRLGKDSQETIRSITQAAIAQGVAIPDLEELSIAAGMEFRRPTAADLPPVSKEAELQADTQKELAEKSAEAQAEIAKQRARQAPAGGRGDRVGNSRPAGSTRRVGNASLNQLASLMYERAKPQIEKGNVTIDLGYERQLRQLIGPEETERFYQTFDAWFGELRETNPNRKVEAVRLVLHGILEGYAE